MCTCIICHCSWVGLVINAFLRSTWNEWRYYATSLYCYTSSLAPDNTTGYRADTYGGGRKGILTPGATSIINKITIATVAIEHAHTPHSRPKLFKPQYCFPKMLTLLHFILSSLFFFFRFCSFSFLSFLMASLLHSTVCKWAMSCECRFNAFYWKSSHHSERWSLSWRLPTPPQATKVKSQGQPPASAGLWHGKTCA